MAYQVTEDGIPLIFQSMEEAQEYLFRHLEVGISESLRMINRSLAGKLGKAKVNKRQVYLRKI